MMFKGGQVPVEEVIESGEKDGEEEDYVRVVALVHSAVDLRREDGLE